MEKQIGKFVENLSKVNLIELRVVVFYFFWKKLSTVKWDFLVVGSIIWLNLIWATNEIDNG